MRCSKVREPGTDPRARELILRLFALLAGASACAPQSTTRLIETPPGSMLLSVVFVEHAGQLQVRSALVTTDPLAGLPAALAPDEEIAAMLWPKSAALDPEGAPLTEDALNASRAVIAMGPEPPPGLGGCGRCLAPSQDAPATIFAGDLCPPPSFALTRLREREATTAEHESLRRQIALAWPGECACPSIKLRPSAVGLEAQALLPVPGARASSLIAVDDRGAVVAAAQDRVFPFAPNGDPLPAILDGERFDRLETLLAIPPGPSFDGGFLLVHRRFKPHGTFYEVVTVSDRDAGRQGVGGPDMLPADAAAVLGGGQILLVGEVENDLRAERCTIAGSPPRLDCRSEVPCPGQICPLTAGLKIAEVEAGLLVVGEGDWILLREPLGPRWRSARLLGLGLPGEAPRFTAATVVGGRFWGCVFFDRGNQVGALVTATVSEAWPSSIPVTEAFRFDLRDPDTATTCDSLWPDPGQRAVWMESHRPGPGHRWVRIGVDGTLTSSRTFSDRPLLRFTRGASGWSAMSARDGSIFRRPPTASEAVQLAGPPVPVRGQPAVAAREDDAIIVGNDRRLVRIGLGVEPVASLSDLEVTPLGITLPPEADTLEEILLRDPSPERVIRLVHTPTTLAIDRVDLSSGRSTRALSRPAPSQWPLKAVAPWADTLLLLFAGGGESSLWSWRIDAPDLVRVDGAPLLVGMAGTSGAAFLWREHQLVRARRAGERVVLDELPFNSSARGDGDPAPGARRVHDLRALCPDTLEVITEFASNTWLLRFCLSGGCAGETVGDTSPTLTTVIPRDTVFSAQVIAGPPDDALVINVSGQVTSARGRLGTMPFLWPYAVTQAGPSLFILSGREGWMAIGLPK
ncbi:MAG: hypothetical protein IT384_03550 [Deltaproteobacteria bacterium]|nr:hypothetical protein [Deltaproteobacteria bacterium]